MATTPITSRPRFVIAQRGTQRVPGEPVLECRHGQDAHAEHVQGLADRRVRVGADRDQRSLRRVGLAPVGGGVAGDHERGQVAGRAAGDEAAARRRREAGLPCQHRERLVLGDHDAGRFEPGGAVERRARHEHVEEQRRLGRGRRDEREEAGTVARDDRGGELVHEELQYAGRVVALGAHEPGQFSVERRDEPTEVEGDRVHTKACAACRQDHVGHVLVELEHRVRHQAGSPSGPPTRACPVRQASSARLATSCSVDPVLSRNDGDVVELRLGAPLGDLHAHGHAVDSDLSELAGRRPALDGVARTPMVPVTRSISARSAATCPASASTWSTWPGRPFFMVTALTHASSAPASSAAGQRVAQLLPGDVVEVGLEHDEQVGPVPPPPPRRAGRGPPGCSWAGRRAQRVPAPETRGRDRHRR